MSDVWMTVTRTSWPVRSGACFWTVHAGAAASRPARQTPAGKVVVRCIGPPSYTGLRDMLASVAMRRAKIVCTLGPASRTPQVVGALIDAGMDVARLNFSHGDYETHLGFMRMVRSEAERRGRPV